MNKPKIDVGVNKVDIGIDYDRPSEQIVVTVDINGSPWFDGSGATLEAALIEALKAASSYAAGAGWR